MHRGIEYDSQITRKYQFASKIGYPYIVTIILAMWGYMRKLVLIIIVLSIFDAAATAAGISLNYIREANPVIGSLVMCDPFAASTLACLLAVALLILIYSFRKRIRWIKYGLTLILAVKAMILCLHLTIIILAVREGLIFS